MTIQTICIYIFFEAKTLSALLAYDTGLHKFEKALFGVLIKFFQSQLGGLIQFWVTTLWGSCSDDS